MTQQIEVVTSRESWAARIAASWRKSVESILETGRLLAEAKALLPHGQFGLMIEVDLPFTPSTAQRLMAIANDPRINDPGTIPLLPPSWGTLYALTKLPDDEFRRRLSGGEIAPTMSRRDVTSPTSLPTSKSSPQAAHRLLGGNALQHLPLGSVQALRAATAQQLSILRKIESYCTPASTLMTVGEAIPAEELRAIITRARVVGA